MANRFAPAREFESRISNYRKPKGKLAAAIFVCLLSMTMAPNALAQSDMDLVWEMPTPFSLPQAIVVDADRPEWMYVALKSSGVGIYRSTDPTEAPQLTAIIRRNQLDGLEAMNIVQQGDVLYIALGNFFNPRGSQAGIAAVDISDPRAPLILSVRHTEDVVRGAAVVCVNKTHAWVGAMDQGVMTYDISDPSSITHISTYQPDVDYPVSNPNRIQHPNARGVAIEGDLLYVAYDAGGLRVLDVSDPLNPIQVGRFVNPEMGDKQKAYNNIVANGRLVYAAVDYAGIEVIDVSDPDNISLVAWWNPWSANSDKNFWANSPGHTNQLILDQENSLLYSSSGDSELIVLDVSNPRRPSWFAKYGEPQNGLGAWGAALSEDQVHLAYIRTVVPFRGTWSGIKTLQRIARE